ncbi:acyl-CoA thioester hydrolase [Clostridium acetobutylicum]|nr:MULTISPECIES: thioesterase family protein [Clostridium]NOV88900.1 acyl-CoA thioester hydrolase [Clostridium acetobutylicum]NOW12761.1 acyl-CoA thioester hydrolase [Clostridium acetobutylicum]NRY55137.1 acyl-CoA thioester hydrolase [Clostridium acetobutylicum]NSA93016.1 acyl-CoA thioester hydrolase [Clostridium acetobutylicum]NYC94069.1 acyl-CoA thioester hydrolase [Clostridium acetobutylicum]
MEHEYRLEVRGYELDSFGHVNNAVYLNYLEAARWDLCSKLNLTDYNESNELFIVVIETNIKYIRELKLFDKVLIKTELTYEDDYLIFKHNIYNEVTKRKASVAKSKMVLVSKQRIIYEIPQFIKDKLDICAYG